MKPVSQLRKFAAWLLKLSHRLSPPSLQTWGEAMLRELDYVEGDWPALAWAAGGAGVLLKRSVIHFVTGRRESAPAAGGQAHRDPVLAGGPMRKFTFGVALLAVVVLTVLFFAPSFRQALAVTTNSWGMIAGRQPISVRALHRLADQARAERDANTLAFVALELPFGAEGDHLADEAVRLDSKLTWIYCLRAAQQWPDKESPQAGDWIAKVQAWDSTNAYPKLLQAQRTSMADGLWSSSRDEAKFRNAPRWHQAMAEVFVATKWDSYFAAQMDLDRDVMRRRHLNDPMLAVYAVSSHPLPNISLLERYALLVLDGEVPKVPRQTTGTPMEKQPATAWQVARLGQITFLQGQTFFERFTGAWLQREAYKRLEKIAEQAGDRDQQAMFAYQIESLDTRRHQLPDNGFLIDVYQWNAAAGQVAVGAILISVILLLVWIAGPAATRLAKLKEGILVRGMRGSGVVGGAGLLASSVALYVSYHPYAEIFNRFAISHGAAQADSLMSFWGFSEFAWTFTSLFPVGFGWLALLILAISLLGFEIYRFFASRGPAQETV